MAYINPKYLNLSENYLFSEVARRVAAHEQKKLQEKIIRLGIGDVTCPLAPSIVEALSRAVKEQATQDGFHGYGPEQGYDFLRKLIVENCYKELGIRPHEIFVGDGAKEDIGNFPEIFHGSSRIAVTDPVYPVYVDSSVMNGNAGSPKSNGRFENLIYLPSTEQNGFVPDLPTVRPDIIYLCFPNNPTGSVLTRDQLRVWVEYARSEECVIFFDAAYEAYISSSNIPHSIYEIEGAKDVAVEFRSYSKTAGFTGLRCGFTVVPETLYGRTSGTETVPLRKLWLRRQTTKYNGCPYIVQRAAAETYAPDAQREISEQISIYMKNAKAIRQGFENLGLKAYGAMDAPYVWVRLPEGIDSWTFFDRLLSTTSIVGTPGVGFGIHGEGHFRLTGFGRPEQTEEALHRLGRLDL